MEIPFTVQGTLKGDTVTLWKKHRGRYCNTVKYNGRVLVDVKTGLYAMRGEYGEGTFALDQIGNVVRWGLFLFLFLFFT